MKYGLFIYIQFKSYFLHYYNHFCLRYIYFNGWICHITKLSQGLLDIAATVDCILRINKISRPCLSKRSFYINISAIYIFSAIFYSYYMFSRYVELSTFNNNNKTVYLYLTKKSHFHKSLFYQILIVMHTAMRDVLTTIILIVLNILIVISLKRITNKKRLLTTKINNPKKVKPMSIAAKIVKRKQSKLEDKGVSMIIKGSVRMGRKAESNKIKMILLMCISFFIGHAPQIPYNLPIHNDTLFWTGYDVIASLLMYIVFASPILIYYFYNNIFKKILNDFFSNFFWCQCFLGKRSENES
jgi:hypothetical protein